MKERPILMSGESKAKGCFRAGVPRPWRYKGGRKAAQDRYRETHKDILKERSRIEYQRNREQYKKSSIIYRKENKEKVNVLNARWRSEFWPALRKELIKEYGGCCVCCGESEPLFLDLDHIKNNGAEDRKKRGNNQRLMVFLKRNNWPKDDYQLLCCNCHHGRHRNGGVCPHKK